MSSIYCPVCGYYCLGKGGIGCIDKPTLINLMNSDDEDEYSQPHESQDEGE